MYYFNYSERIVCIHINCPDGLLWLWLWIITATFELRFISKFKFYEIWSIHRSIERNKNSYVKQYLYFEHTYQAKSAKSAGEILEASSQSWFSLYTKYLSVPRLFPKWYKSLINILISLIYNMIVWNFTQKYLDILWHQFQYWFNRESLAKVWNFHWSTLLSPCFMRQRLYCLMCSVTLTFFK